MPRTKRPVRKPLKTTEDDETLKKLNKLVQEQKNKVDTRANMEVKNIELAYKMLVGSFSNTDLDKTIGQLKKEINMKEVQTRRSATGRSSRTASHDDGYLTENSSQSSGGRGASKLRAPSSVMKSVTKSVRRSRSADTGRAPPSTARPQRRRSRSVFRTPAYNKNALTNFPPITPKVNPQTPLTLLRQPRQGEMVVSMSGSPVMVPSCYSMQSDDQANCNILLRDGTMLSVQPKQLRESQAYIPFSLMNDTVLHQLRMLKDNLHKMVQLGEKAIAK